uniref:Uncharacterized protein n=1 Tax=Arundo donax TaxID=35708 RepID=A0A0A9HBH5_ARUDO
MLFMSLTQLDEFRRVNHSPLSCTAIVVHHLKILL